MREFEFHSKIILKNTLPRDLLCLQLLLAKKSIFQMRRNLQKSSEREFDKRIRERIFVLFCRFIIFEREKKKSEKLKRESGANDVHV